MYSIETQSAINFVLYQQSDKSVLKNKHGEYWMEVKNGVVFGVTQYEGYKDQHYVCFHTSTICLYHQGNQLQDCRQISICSFLQMQ